MTKKQAEETIVKLDLRREQEKLHPQEELTYAKAVKTLRIANAETELADLRDSLEKIEGQLAKKIEALKTLQKLADEEKQSLEKEIVDLKAEIEALKKK